MTTGAVTGMDQITDAMVQVPLMATYRGQFTPGKMRSCCDEGERRRWQLNELKCMRGKFRPGLWHGRGGFGELAKVHCTVPCRADQVSKASETGVAFSSFVYGEFMFILRSGPLRFIGLLN